MTANADMTPDDGERRHLPECSKSIIPDFYNERWVCICAPLRACEQRVRMEDDDYAYVAAQAEADGRRRGWVEALDAAREAVAALPEYQMRDTCIAAIEQLREERK